MEIYYTIIFFVFGLFFGSFYNVVGLRLGQEKSIVKPRSSCPKCGHVLNWYELIPVFSFIFLGGKCKECKQKISIMYPLIELFTGILSGLSFYVFGFTYELGIALIVSSLFSIIIVSDLNYMVIPDQVLILSGVLIVIINFLNKGITEGLYCVLYGVIVFMIMFLVMRLGNFIFKKESLGGGDIKLMLVLGMTMPLISSVFSIFLASLIALPISLIVLIKNKDNIVPFGPFLCAGCLISVFMKLDVNTLYSFLTNIFK